MKIARLGILLVVAAGISGCSSQGNVDIGDNHDASLGASLTDYAGSWEGYAEALTFPDGTDRVRLNLDATGKGALELGNDAPALPEPNADAAPPGWKVMGTTVLGPDVMTGYPFTVPGATVLSKRIKLTTVTPVEYEQWCALQTSVPYPHSDQPEFHCIPGAGYRKEGPDGSKCYIFFDDGSEVEAPCGKLECVMICTCAATGCTYNGGPTFELDAALDNDGADLVGTLIGVGVGRVTVRLEKK